MMFRSLARNNSCVPLSCALGLGFIPAPPNKIARFRHSTCRNLAISPNKNQQQSTGKMQIYSILNGGLFRLRITSLIVPVPFRRPGGPVVPSAQLQCFGSEIRPARPATLFAFGGVFQGLRSRLTGGAKSVKHTLSVD